MRFVKKLLSYFRKAEAGSKPQGHETEAASEPQTHDVCGNCYYYQPAEYLGVEPPSPLREWPSDSGLCNKGQRKPFVVHVGQHLHIVRKTDDACDDFEKGSSGLVVVKDTPDEALHDAASAGDTATLRRLIAEGVDVNAEAFNGETPLLRATRSGSKDVMELLIELGADVNRGGHDGTTPLQQATLIPCEEKMALLLDRGANVNAQNSSGFTPLISATISGDIEIAKFLIGQGADLEVGDKDGLAPLHHAARLGNVEMAQALIEKGADVTAHTHYGDTPLDIAVAWEPDRLDEIAALLR